MSLINNLTISWQDPTPVPVCGYSAYYRRKGDPAYLSINTSGTTSGVTVVNASVVGASCYEGYIQSNCCSGNLSAATPFGTNSYESLTFSLTVSTSPTRYTGTISSITPNPYNIYISGTFTDSISGPQTFSNVVYLAGNTLQVLTVPGTPGSTNSVISNMKITSTVPLFDGGGTLQLFDAVNTPSYFAFYNSSPIGTFFAQTSGVTWLGSPATLPSFTLDAFNVTATDTGGNPLAGILLVSWIQDSLYTTSGTTLVYPYTQVIFQIKDAGNNILGTLVTAPGPLGLVNAAIPITRASSSYPLTPSTQFVMATRRADSSLIASNIFYLPLPS